MFGRRGRHGDGGGGGEFRSTNWRRTDNWIEKQGICFAEVEKSSEDTGCGLMWAAVTGTEAVGDLSHGALKRNGDGERGRARIEHRVCCHSLCAEAPRGHHQVPTMRILDETRSIVCTSEWWD